MKLVPSELFAETGEKSNCQEVGILARSFVDLARKNPSLAQNIIAEYIKEEKKLVDKKELNANTVPNHIKPIKFLLDANGIAIHWKSLHKLFPRPQKTEDRAYTKEEIQKMLEVAPDIADKVIIQMFSSGGFRLGAWDYFTWKDVIFFKNKDDSYKGAALLVYRGDPESYWTFITPEACKTLEIYQEAWKSKLGRYPLPDDPLIKSVKLEGVHRLDIKGIRRRMDKIVTKIGLRPPLSENKKRHEVALDHGFRKYFNTMMRRAKVDYLDKEDMMGHKTGLERHYERYREEDFERFVEYQKAIPFLTISEEEILRTKTRKLEQEKTELEKNIPQLVNQAMDRIKNELIREGWTIT
ncbi:MAG TPA: site-specific integrase [Nitrosopumilaceae archaeon]|nr:site-specific integrase [Nitrosopumilaceae archaeon]